MTFENQDNKVNATNIPTEIPNNSEETETDLIGEEDNESDFQNKLDFISKQSSKIKENIIEKEKDNSSVDAIKIQLETNNNLPEIQANETKDNFIEDQVNEIIDSDDIKVILDNPTTKLDSPLDDKILSFNIYHFTDLHLKKGSLNEYEELFKKIIDYISINFKENKSNHFFVLFTGDIFNNNQLCDESSSLFLNFIENITKILIDYSVYFIISVGNHDMNANTCEYKGISPTRGSKICSYLEELKSITINDVKTKIGSCKSANEKCICENTIINKCGNDHNDFLQKVYYFNTEITKDILDIENCFIFNESISNKPSNCVKKIINDSRLAIDRGSINDIFNDNKLLIDEIKPSNTYQKFTELFKLINSSLSKFNNKQLITFYNDIEHTEGYKKIPISDSINIGVVNINTSWMSSLGDHLNFGNMYITDIEKDHSNNEDLNRYDYNVVVFHHPLEYISLDCNKNINYVLDNFAKRNETNIHIGENLFNSGYCGHIHFYNGDETYISDDTPSSTFKSLRQKNIKMPGALIPQTVVSDNIEQLPLEIIKNNKFDKMTYEGKIFEEGGYENYYSNIAFFETNVILNSGVIFEVNSKIALTKNS